MKVRLYTGTTRRTQRVSILQVLPNVRHVDADIGDFVAVSSGSFNKPKPSHTKKGRAEFGSRMLDEANA